MITRIPPSISRLSSVDLTVICLTAYCLLFGLSKLTGINLYGIPGVLLLMYLPGRQLLYLYPPLAKPWGSIGQAALAVFLSVSIMVTIQVVLSRFGITSATTILPTLSVNALLYAGGILKNRYGKEARRTSEQAYALALPKDLWPLFVVLLVVGIVIIFSPYPADADGFLTALQKSLECHCTAIGFRQAFIAYQALVHIVLALPFTITFRTLFPFLFFVSTWFGFDYALRRIPDRPRANVAYLSILIAPVILSEVNIIRPQVAMLAYTLPILIIAVEAWRTESLILSSIALWFSLISISFHELSIFLLTVALIPFIGIAWRTVFIERRITGKHVALAVVVLLPYFKILTLGAYFSKLENSVKLAVHLFPPVHWRWWFINNYVTIDGFNLGWPGVQALYYYAYSGIALLGFVIILLLWRKMKRIPINRSIALPLAYTAIFFVFAEIFPRLGFFFLPNRAWVHLMLGLCVAVLILYEGKFSQRAARIMAQFPIFLIMIGVAGTLYVARNNVSEIFREETPALQFIKSTSADSLFLSTQDNHTLIQFYGHRRYSIISANQKLDRAGFDQLVDRQLQKFKEAGTVEISPEIRQEVKQYEDDRLISAVVKILVPRQFSIIEPIYSDGTPVYFVYSLRKASGVNAARAYNGALIDISNKDTYQHIGYQPVYDNGSIMIIKVR